MHSQPNYCAGFKPRDACPILHCLVEVSLRRAKLQQQLLRWSEVWKGIIACDVGCRNWLVVQLFQMHTVSWFQSELQEHKNLSQLLHIGGVEGLHAHQTLLISSSLSLFRNEKMYSALVIQTCLTQSPQSFLLTYYNEGYICWCCLFPETCFKFLLHQKEFYYFGVSNKICL